VGQDDFLFADGGELDRGAAVLAEAGERHDFAWAVFVDSWYNCAGRILRRDSMGTSLISIEVDASAALACDAASADEKRKLQLLLNLRLREIMAAPQRSLQQIMDEIGANAKERGLTPEILESMLCDP